jgi:hypothetical protein
VYVRTCADRFEIEERIMADRVSKTRTDMIVADEKQKERERQRAAAGGYQPRRQERPASEMPPMPQDMVGMDVPPPVPDGYYPEDYGAPAMDAPVEMPPVMIPEGPVVINEPYLAPCEKELLGFILEEGCTELQFDVDSKYYVEGETINVAEFIDGTLADDEEDFVNQSYRKVYDEYFRMYDEGLTQQQMQSRLLNSMDPEIAAVAKELLIEKYQITVKNYEQSLTATSTILVQFIPKALLAYHCKKIELILKGLTAELTTEQDPDRQIDILAKISDYNRARTKLNNELGRV